MVRVMGIIRSVFNSVLVNRLVIPLLLDFRDIVFRVLVRYFRDKFGMGDSESEDVARVVIRLVFREVEFWVEKRYGISVDLDLDGV